MTAASRLLASLSTARRRLFLALPVLVVVALSTLGLGNLRGMPTPSFLPRLINAQLWWLGLGLLAAILTAVVDYRLVQRQAYRLFAAGFALLLLVPVLGETAYGSRRWLDLGLFHLQPSELMKLLLVVALARHAADNPSEPRPLKDLLVPVLLTAAPMALVLRQPDLSSAVILGLISLTLLVLTGLRLRTVAAAGVAGLALLPLVWAFVLRGYQRARVLAFLDPTGDPQGVGWQTQQSMVAIGSGGLLGKGPGMSSQLSFVPCHHNDLPFSIFCEERGLVGAVVVLVLFIVLCQWCVAVSRRARDRFGAALSAGVGGMLFWQVMVNLAVALGLVPPTGVSLPFFSTGGSSAFTMLLGLGLVLSVELRRALACPADRRAEVSVLTPQGHSSLRPPAGSSDRGTPG